MVLIVILIFITSCSKTGTTSTTSTGTIACSKDSDCGISGVQDVCYQKSTVYRSTVTYTCLNAGTVTSSCRVERGDLKALKDCSPGEICDKGRCIIPPLTCQDSDGGIDEFTVGKVQVGSDSYLDKCINKTVLREYYCENNTVASQLATCENGCSVYACK